MDVRCCKYLFSACLVIIFMNLLDVTLCTEEDNEGLQNKNGRFLSMFEIINFPNDACKGDSKNGTCYTSAECEDKGGTKDGDCAQGYGVCCIFQVECGATITQNNTYFTKPSSFSTGECAVQMCPGEDICQLRLDFTSFVINGPYSTTDTTTDTGANSQVKQDWQWGQIQNGGIAVIPLEGNCVKDTFSVTSSSGTNPPTICGRNSGEHMYVDVKGGSCNSMAFNVDSGSSDNTWSVQVTEFDCDYNNLAPEGCTQYFFGEANGKFKSFNWEGGNHLANQNQNICFRRESGKSKICFSTVDDYKDFQVGNGEAATPPNSQKGWNGMTASANGAACCNYGNAGQGGKGGMFDCLQIPGASDGADACLNNANTANCADGALCGPAGIYVTGGKNKVTLTTIKETVCTKRTPFHVRFLTDSNELAINEVSLGLGLKGFRLAYIIS